MATNAEVRDMVIAALERCLAMQADHLAGLKKGCLSKINQWLEERQAMVARLRQALAEVQPSQIDADLRALLLDRLAAILDGEQVIFAIAEQQRTDLQEKVSVLRRGKRALNGYGPTIIHRPPRFVSEQR